MPPDVAKALLSGVPMNALSTSYSCASVAFITLVGVDELVALKQPKDQIKVGENVALANVLHLAYPVHCIN